jgi:hypothetical protein
MKNMIFFLFLTSCALPSANLQSNNFELNFNDDLTFIEFNNLLIEYVKKSSYPNIND